jgi:acyl carrier protein
MNTLEYVTLIVRSVANERQKILIDEDTDFLSRADLDSLAMLEIMDTLEKQYQASLFDVIDLREVNTPRKLAEHIDRTLQQKPGQ